MLTGQRSMYAELASSMETSTGPFLLVRLATVVISENEINHINNKYKSSYGSAKQAGIHALLTFRK